MNSIHKSWYCQCGYFCQPPLLGGFHHPSQQGHEASSLVNSAARTTKNNLFNFPFLLSYLQAVVCDISKYWTL